MTPEHRLILALAYRLGKLVETIDDHSEFMDEFNRLDHTINCARRDLNPHHVMMDPLDEDDDDAL